ncbi:hypothetical protein D3C73_1301770 [compost metagenome]
MSILSSRPAGGHRGLWYTAVIIDQSPVNINKDNLPVLLLHHYSIPSNPLYPYCKRCNGLHVKRDMTRLRLSRLQQNTALLRSPESGVCWVKRTT